jgi:endoglucanase
MKPYPSIGPPHPRPAPGRPRRHRRPGLPSRRGRPSVAAVVLALGACVPGAVAWQSDNGNGTFINTNTASSAGYGDVDSLAFGDAATLVTVPRGRPRLNAARTTFVADNGQPLRGPYTSTEWTSAVPYDEIAAMKEFGFNAVHLYAESFDPSYPTNGSTAPGYHAVEVDKIVQYTRDLGLYLVMTIGNGANNGNHNLAWATNFWNFYAPRYANESHVLYEIHNEPVAWGPSYVTAQSPPGAMTLETSAYNIIRAHAPDTPVLLFSYAVLAGAGGSDAALTDIRAFNQAVFGTTNAAWTNVAVGFHGYGGAGGTAVAVSNLLSAGYPCFMTEFGTGTWGGGPGGLDIEAVANWERLGVSWLTFQFVPPTGVSDDVTRPECYRDRVEWAGLSWTPDYGTWPVARGVFDNGGYPWTAPDYSNGVLGGALRIEAENFDQGGKGVAYYNTQASNPGGLYRTNETVGVEAASDAGGGYDVGWIAAGDWLEYTMKTPVAGTYDLRLRVAGTGGGRVRLLPGGVEDLTGVWALPNSGGGQTWTTVSKRVFFKPGQQRLRVEALAAGFNLNWIEIAPASTGPIADGTFRIVNAANGLALDVDSNNTVVTASPSGSSYQQWNIQHIGGGQYRVRCGGNGWYWSLWAGPLHLTWWVDGYYMVEPLGNGFCRVFSAGGGRSLAPSSGNPPTLDEQTWTGAAAQQWALLSPSAPAFPVGLSATATAATQILLAWNAVPGATSYTVKRAAASGGPYAAVATGLTATNYTDTVPVGMRYYYVVSAAFGAVESVNSLEATVALPYPWRTADLGAVGLTGGAAFSNGLFAVSGSGSDIWGTSDEFRFVYLAATGDCTIVARVVSVQSTDPWAKAGVMIRASLTATSPHAFVAVTPGNGVAMQYRSTAGGNSVNNNTTGPAAPYWVRLVRSGNTFTGSRSADGTNWIQVGSTTIAMASAVQIGLAVSSHNDGSLCTAAFDHVTAAGWTTQVSPPAPTGLSAVAVSTGEIGLAWSPVAGATGYLIKRSAADGGPYAVVATGVTATSHLDGGLDGGTRYYYVVSAIVGDGETPDSAQATAATLSPTLDSLVHRYSFDATGGMTVADSVGGPVWNGTLPAGGTFAAGRLTLSAAAGQQVRLPDGIVGSLTSLTIVAWVNLESSSVWTRIFDFGNDTAANMFLTPRNGIDGRLRFAITTGGGGAEEQINGEVILGTGVWYHVAVTLDGGVGILYVDGVPVGSNGAMTLKPSDLGATTHNYLGRSQYPADPYLDGALDEFRIYDAALTAADIAATHALGVNQLLSAEPPELTFARTPENPSVEWPLACAGYTLQSTTNPVAAAWADLLSPAPQIAEGQWRVTPPYTGASAAFFRLVK